MLPTILEKTDIEKEFAVRLLGLLTALAHMSTRLPSVGETLAIYLNISNKQSHFLIKIVFNFLHSKSSACVYQAMKILSLLVFINPEKAEY